MTFSQLCSVLGGVAKIDLHPAVATGSFRLSFDGSIDILFERGSDDNILHMHCDLAHWSEDQLTQLPALLEAHLFGIATDDAYFGLDRRFGRLLLFKTVHFDTLPGDEVMRAVERFVTQCAHWRDRLAGPWCEPSVRISAKGENQCVKQ
jgi:hypothetical protein